MPSFYFNAMSQFCHEIVEIAKKVFTNSHNSRYHCHQKIIILWHKCDRYKKLTIIENFVMYLDQSYNFVIEMTSFFFNTILHEIVIIAKKNAS